MEDAEEEGLLPQRRFRGVRHLFEGHYRAMFGFAYRLTGDADIAEDITQE
jgi:DNA-directed RNA polymerase specialized sigma24 family protein